ncbi:MAG: zinc ribbon domain-containing protein [Candidatus Lernaella stagnicola]|nr:zinc ribbon domain-containing protein [Candidatus Lernaella stagnicola]
MPIYEYRCEDCGQVSSFMEKMFERPRLFRRRKRCKHCRSKRLVKIPSGFGVSVERTQTEMLNELKSMGNVQFVPQQASPTPQGPPDGKCPYCDADQSQEEKKPPEPEKIEVI